MAEAKKEEFHSFLIKKDYSEYPDLEDEIKETKGFYKFSDILSSFGLTVPYDVISFREALSREVKAYSDAEKYLMDYVANKDLEYGKGAKSGGKVKTYDDYFAKVKELKSNGHFEDYENYLMEADKIANNDELDDTERAAQLADLERKNSAIIRDEEEYTKLKEKANYMNDFCGVLNGMPQDMQQNLLTFYQRCQDKGLGDQFNQTLSEYLVDTGHYPKQGKDKPIENKHVFSLHNDSLIKHEIYNLGGTGLDVCIVDGKIGFLKSEKNLTQAQVAALAGYCQYNAISIPDYGQLEAMNVLDEKGEVTDKTVAEGLRENIEELQKQKQQVSEENLHNAAGMQDDRIEPAAGPDTTPTPSGSVDEVFSANNPLIKQPGTKEYDKDKVLDAIKGPLKMSGAQGKKMKVRDGWNSTTITVYNDAKDRWNGDTKLNKDGWVDDNRAYTMKIVHSTPPKIYFNPRGKFKEFKADHAKAMLKGVEAAGYKYFVAPPVDDNGIGKSAMEAWLKASVSTGIVPLLKGSPDGRGMMISESDIKNILKFVKEDDGMQNNTAKRHEYLIRLAEQIEKCNRGCGKKLPVEKIKTQVKFEAIDAIKDDIKVFFKNGVDKEGWDKLKEIAAYQVLGQIMKDIHKNGMLNGKPFNPLDQNNGNLIKKAIEEKLKPENGKNRSKLEQDIEKDINMKYHNIILSGRAYDDPAKDKKYDEIYKNELSNAIQEVGECLKDVREESGVELDFSKMKKVTAPMVRPKIIDTMHDQARKLATGAGNFSQGISQPPTNYNRGGRS